MVPYMQVLSKSELQFLALLPTLRPKVRVIAECGNWLALQKSLCSEFIIKFLVHKPVLPMASFLLFIMLPQLCCFLFS